MKLTPNRVSWFMTGVIGIGVLGTTALSIGVIGNDRYLIAIGFGGEFLTMAASMALFGWCVREGRKVK